MLEAKSLNTKKRGFSAVSEEKSFPIHAEFHDELLVDMEKGNKNQPTGILTSLSGVL